MSEGLEALAHPVSGIEYTVSSIRYAISANRHGIVDIWMMLPVDMGGRVRVREAPRVEAVRLVTEEE